MTREQADQLQSFAEEAEHLAEAFHEHPTVDDPETEAALMELVDHHLTIVPEVARADPDSGVAAVAQQFIAADAVNLPALEEQLEAADQELADAARHRETDAILAVAATAVLILVGGLITGLVVMSGLTLW